jgi:CRP-like cAMP-binding protein
MMMIASTIRTNRALFLTGRIIALSNVVTKRSLSTMRMTTTTTTPSSSSSSISISMLAQQRRIISSTSRIRPSAIKTTTTTGTTNRRMMSRISNNGINNNNKIANFSKKRRQNATLAPRHGGKRQQQQQQRHPTTATATIESIKKQIKELFFIYRDQLNLWLTEPRLLPVPRWISPRHITYKVSEVFGHCSFFLVAVSYAVDDFLHLRILAIAGSSAMLVFTYFHPHGRILWLPFQWNIVFVLLNTWRVAKVYLDRIRSEQLSNGLSNLYDHHFYVMEKADFARLVQLGTKEKFNKGDTIVHQDHDNRYVRLVVSGDLIVDRDGQTTYLVHEGQFISEMGLHAGLGLRGTVTSCCSVKAASDEGVELVRWDRTELMHLLELHKSIDRTLKAVMSWDIVSKLKSQRVLLASGHIDDAEHWTIKRREQSSARYMAILRNMLVHPDYLNARKGQLTKYREIHQVSYRDHVTALHDIGWTVDEFEAGIKEGQLDEDELEKKNLGFEWWFKSWWKAL